MTLPESPHRPVLLDEVVHALSVTPGQIVVDGTFGAGGYARALLAAGACVHAFDRDPSAIAEGADLAGGSEGRLVLHPARFSEMDQVLRDAGVDRVDAVVLDIGVSSMQLDRAERGFSFRADGPLDMRMEGEGMSAADFLNAADEQEIADVIYRLGDERKSRRIARAIVAARPLRTTSDLAHAVHRAIGRPVPGTADPATRTFQAVRIHVNGELDELRLGLAAAERLLKPDGRLAVVSFHSLEDRIVKLFFRERSGSAPATSRHLPQLSDRREPSFRRPARPVRPGEAELRVNPRARSATLRSAVRTAAPPWEAPISAAGGGGVR